MLKIRVMPTLLFKEVGLVKGVGFNSWRRVGSAMQAVKVYNMREVDELVFLDITANQENRHPDYATVDELADECFMPLTVGGGIKTIDHVHRLLKVGADKVAINTAAVESPDLIRQIAEHFGSQCVVVSIDAKQHSEKQWEAYTHSGTRPTGLSPLQIALQAQKLGAGEILLTSIERDGTMTGYDIPLMQEIAQAVSIPVIASGGAGSYSDMADVLSQSKVSAVAAASIFHFTQQTPLEAKRYLHERGFKVRLGSS